MAEPTRGPEDFTEKIRIVFRGKQADANSLPIDDLVESLGGWGRYFDLTATIYIQGRLTQNLLPRNQRPQLRVQEIRPGSVEVVLTYVGLAMAGGIIGNASWAATKLFAKKLSEFRRRAFVDHVNKKIDDATVEEAAAGLRQLANEVPYRGTDRDPIAVVESIEAALRHATEPLDAVAESITVESESEEEVLTVTRSERRAIISEFSAVGGIEDESEWFKAMIRVYRLNQQSGSASFNFITPQDEDQQGSHRVTIHDPKLRKKFDPYSGSMHTREAIEVYARKRYLDLESEAFKWDLRSEPPSDNSSLFM